MATVKVIRLMPELVYTSRRKKENLKDTLSGTGTIPDAMEPIERIVREDSPKAHRTLVYLANRNAAGLPPKLWYACMCEGLGLELVCTTPEEVKESYEKWLSILQSSTKMEQVDSTQFQNPSITEDGELILPSE